MDRCTSDWNFSPAFLAKGFLQGAGSMGSIHRIVSLCLMQCYIDI